MKTLKLVVPDLGHEKAVMDFRQEFLDSKERISGSAGLEQADSYEKWLQHEYTPHYGKVAESIFLASDEDNYLVGISDIRLQMNDFIERYAGQIGYSVRPSQRKKGVRFGNIEAYIAGSGSQGLSSYPDNL